MDASGGSDQGNGGDGIRITAWNNVISTSVVSGNNDGINLNGSDAVGNSVYTSKIGTNATGTVKIGNSASGVALLSGARNNVIGDYGRGNVIAGNGNGVFIANGSTRYNSISSNWIGTNAVSAAGLGNTFHGVTLYDGAYNNLIGGYRASGQANTISGNGGNGIDLRDATTRENYIYGNQIGTE